MTEILYGLRDSQRARLAALREAGEFFWMDVSLRETSLDDLVEALDLPERAAQAWQAREAGDPSRGFHADGHHVFTTSCYVEPSDGPAGAQRMRPVETRVLVSGEYLLTIHEEPVALTKLLAPDIVEGRSEQYVVYSVLDAMVGTAFAALNELELMLDDLMAGRLTCVPAA